MSMRFIDVSFRYSGMRDSALKTFGLAVERGSVVALLGPNGSGKSTALGLGAGWLKPGSGRVERTGQAAFLPQTERLAFAFTCLEYVSFGRAPHLPYLGLPKGVDVNKAEDALGAVGALAMRARDVASLSGGELQLVRLARALAQETDTIILDEPTDALDPYHSAALAGLVRNLADGGRSVLLSTHDIAFALACADRAALLKEGRLIAEGPAQAELSASALADLYGTAFSVASLPSPFARA